MCGLHSLSREEAAVFSLSTRVNERGGAVDNVKSTGQSESIMQNIDDCDGSNSDGLIATSEAEEMDETNEWSEPEPDDAECDIELSRNESVDYASDPEPDFNE
jgi:hypothetical protein